MRNNSTHIRISVGIMIIIRGMVVIIDMLIRSIIGITGMNTRYSDAIGIKIDATCITGIYMVVVVIR